MFPGAYLVSYRDERQAFSGVERFDYRVELDWYGAEEFEAVFTFLMDVLAAEGWEITDSAEGGPWHLYYTIHAARGDEELEITIGEWFEGGLGLGALIQVVI